MKIGELLIREGLITPGQLEEALKMQVIFGGRLGTNLIEMGILEENQIARMLSRKLRIPFADPAELMPIPPQVLATVPREIAERHQVIPLRLENRRLTLAMANPTDLRAVDEIAFRTGYVIQPVVTPEIRLVQALETHYRIARDLRYIAVGIPAGRSTSATPPPAAFASPAARAPRTLQKPPPAVCDAGVLTRPASVPAIEPAPIVEEIRFEEEESLPDQGLDAVARLLAEAGSRDDIADLAIGWAGANFRRAALFLVRPDGAQGWRAALDGRPVAGFDSRLRIPLAEPSVLKTVADSRSWYLGPLHRTPFNSLFLQELGGGVPQTTLLLPLLMMGRVIAILYVDGQDSALQEQLHRLQKLAAKMVMAFEILVLKNKIVML